MTRDEKHWAALAVAGAGTIALLSYRIITGKGAFLRAVREAGFGRLDDVEAFPTTNRDRRLAALEGKAEEQDKQIASLVSWASRHWHPFSDSTGHPIKAENSLPAFTPGDVYNQQNPIDR